MSTVRFVSLTSTLVLVAGLAVATVGGDPIPETIEFRSEIGSVEFPHRAHAEDFGVECVECHHETNAAPLELPHPHYFEDGWKECRKCHHESGSGAQARSCSACHPDAPFSVADETLSSKVVIHRSCWTCHETGRGAEASSQCGSCHRRDAISSRPPVDPGVR